MILFYHLKSSLRLVQLSLILMLRRSVAFQALISALIVGSVLEMVAMTKNTCARMGSGVSSSAGT